jgi:hypothetical protein
MSVRNPLPALLAAAVVFIVTFVFSASGIPVRALAAAGLPVVTPTPLGGASSQVGQATPLPQFQGADQAVRAAFQQAMQKNSAQVQAPGLLVFDPYIDHIDFSQDGSSALVWIGLRDRETGDVVASEPGISIARNLKQALSGDPASWSISLPGGSQSAVDWANQIRALPQDLLTPDVQDRYLSQPANQPAGIQAVDSAQVFTGYKLPWAAGLSKYVTNSIGHVYSVDGGYASCPTTCRYAFDFADGTMFSLIAAKGGTVKSFKWTCPNGGTSCTNFLILEDQSTIPTSYQIYYHMAYNTIPERLRTVGAAVAQGEYIGNADDTGNSTGHHLHFHVYTSPTATDWSWGYSVDFTFDDVTTNGGRPRTCSEASAYPNMGSQCMSHNLYTSGNTPANLPQGSLDQPADMQMITSRMVHVEGSASDDIQVTRIQVVANYDGTWENVDDITLGDNGLYAKDVDLCTLTIPDGPFDLSVRIYDREGSLAPGIPVRHLIKAFTCGGVEPPAPPACVPAANQVALYADTDFRGTCQKFDMNTSAGYTASTLTTIGDNKAASIQVGSSVRAVLYDRSGDVTAAQIAGRIETFESSDTSLIDNRIGANHVSGLWVLPRSNYPDEPVIRPVGNKIAATASPSSVDSLVLAWDGGVSATAFDFSLVGVATNWTSSVSGANSVSVGNLAAGSYTFTVRSKNSVSTKTSSKTFTVTQASLPTAAARTVPFTDSMESGAGNWVSSGLWRLGSVNVGGKGATQAWIFNNGTDYNNATYRAGDLTSPPVTIPATGTYYLRFAYYMDTEDGYAFWDQRLVQISVDGGPFIDLIQLTDDKEPIGPVWLNSGPLSLAKFAGETIRVRFHFDAIDQDYNSGLGWMVDDVSINSTAPDTSCADTSSTPDTAQAITMGATVSAMICPERDIDYYKVTAKTGQPVVIDIDARTLSPASKLDSVVTLLDVDKRSPIAESDDEQYGVLQDSNLPYVFQRDGTYYIKVKAWNYPGVGGKDFFYNLSLKSNVPVAPQDASIQFPVDSQQVPATPFMINVSATDYDGGSVAQVDFYWHGPDWSQNWVKLGTDKNGSDGWSYRVDPSQYGGVQGSALYVQAISRTGGVKGAVMWDLAPDLAIPHSELEPLPAPINSTVLLLNWSATDLQNDIDHFDLQYQEITGSGTSAWKDWQDAFHPYPIPGYARSAWFSGLPGVTYNFRLRAVNHAGNAEYWMDQPQASTTLGVTCTPDANEIANQTQSNAYLLPRDDFSPVLNFCKSTQAGAGDVDWFMLDAKAGETLLFMIVPGGGGTAFTANLYNASSQLAAWTSTDYENSVSARWVAPVSGRYYLEIKPLRAGMAGTDMKYGVWYGSGNWLYFPITIK